MDTRVAEVLAGKQVSYILPFFWQQGESEEILREYMGAIYNSGIYEVCVESRPHPDFYGPGWWRDMGIIMNEARTRGMRVWLLDDAHFPTGYANGAFKTADPALCLQFMNFNMVDVVGPTPHVTIDVEKMTHEPPAPAFPRPGGNFPGREKRVFDDDQCLAVIAYQIEEGDKLGVCLDLTSQVKAGLITWNVPTGYWRIYTSYLTHNAGMQNTVMNIIDHDSVRVLVDAIYEPQYMHFRDDFGKTFAGFFSDEPCFRNAMGFGRDTRIGRLEMPLPWNQQVPGMLAERLGPNWPAYLPHLWQAGADADLTARVRYAYMDVITELVKVNFSNQLGEWCEAHNVEYIGHAVEDNNSSSHLGSSLGHFYRALDGQHMAGIDEVILQVVFGGENARHRNGHFVQADGNFYHFALAKLASSHAHIDPKKQGRSLCEIWGASGWAFGIRNMMYVANHFLVRGVNRYTPHAFNPDTFPSQDGPPHFYAHGENPQYRHFGALSRYMQRVCHLIDGGLHVAPVAILYSGEADWVGACMFEQYPARKLTENQIDFDILPGDILAEGQHTLADGLVINGERYSALVIPAAEYTTTAVATFAQNARKVGFPVLFVGNKPRALSDSTQSLGDIPGEVVALSDLVLRLRELGVNEISVSPEFKQFVYYHYRRESDLYLFANEATSDVFDGWISIPQRGNLCLYDPWENVLRPVEYEETNSGTRFHLKLAPYELVVLVCGDKGDSLIPKPNIAGQGRVLKGWRVSMSESKGYPNFIPAYEAETLSSFGDKYPDFSGFIAYETEFDGTDACLLEIADAYEGVEVWCNGEYAGMRITPPFVFNLGNLVTSGMNKLRIEVATTLDRKVRTFGIVNHFLPDPPILEPTGIVGEVRLYRK